MTELILVLIGIIVGIFVGLAIMLVLMGAQLRNQFLGHNLENKPVVIEWLDGHTKDFNIMMRGVPVFTGVIQRINIGRELHGPSTVQIELMSKAEVMRRVFTG